MTERDRLDLRGLLPPNVMTPEQQIERYSKYTYFLFWWVTVKIERRKWNDVDRTVTRELTWLERELEEWFDGVESSNHAIKLSLLRSLYDWCVTCALTLKRNSHFGFSWFFRALDYMIVILYEWFAIHSVYFWIKYFFYLYK